MLTEKTNWILLNKEESFGAVRIHPNGHVEDIQVDILIKINYMSLTFITYIINIILPHFWMQYIYKIGQ